MPNMAFGQNMGVYKDQPVAKKLIDNIFLKKWFYSCWNGYKSGTVSHYVHYLIFMLVNGAWILIIYIETYRGHELVSGNL